MIYKKYWFIISALFAKITVNLIGVVSITEIIAFLSFKSGDIFLKKLPEAIKITNLLLVVTSGVLLSCILNNTSIFDSLRGIAGILSTLILFIFYIKVFNRAYNYFNGYLITSSFMNYIVGLGLFNNGLEDLHDVGDNYFKVKYAGILTPMILFLANYIYIKYNKNNSVIILIVSGLSYIVLGARSTSLTFFITAVLLYVSINKIKYNIIKITITIVITLIILYLGYILYIELILSGQLESSNTFIQIAKAQNPYNPFELLFYGRGEFFILIDAALDKPIFGYGPWAIDKTDSFSVEDLFEENKQIVFGENQYIPTHSIFLGIWIWGGLISFIALFLVYLKLMKLWIKVYISKYNIYYMPSFIFLMIQGIWGYFFSPIVSIRIDFPILAAMIIYENYRIEKG